VLAAESKRMFFSTTSVVGYSVFQYKIKPLFSKRTRLLAAL
jgi:hypothetical protein